MRPRERYSLQGPDHMPDDELLALAIGLGNSGRSTLDIARDVLDRFGDLRGAVDAPVDGLMRVPGLGRARAVQIHAALHAGRRAARPREALSGPMSSAVVMAEAFRPHLMDLRIEEFHALYLDARMRLIAHRALTRGSEDATVVDPRQVFRPAVQIGANRVVVAHNHPSGDPTPSELDRQVTRRLSAAGRLLGLELIDHLVFGGERWVSMRALGLMD